MYIGVLFAGNTIQHLAESLNVMLGYLAIKMNLASGYADDKSYNKLQTLNYAWKGKYPFFKGILLFITENKCR